MYQGRHGQLLEPALSELWPGGDGVRLNVGGQGVPFLRNAGYNSNIRLHCFVKYFCELHAIQLSNANYSLESYFCFSSQFHPEKNMFEWAPWHTSIPHSRQSQQSQSWSWLRSGLIDVRIVGECQIMKIVSQQKPNVPKLQITNLVSAGCHIVTEGQYKSRAVLGKYSKIKKSFFIQLKSSPLANAGSMRLKVWNWGRWWMGISF